MKRSFIPFGIFALILVFLGIGLTLRPNELPSPLMGKPAPAFRLPLLASPAQSLSPKDMLGKVWVLNVWASWCVACRQEHAALVEASSLGIVPIYGLNYKDQRDAAIEWLSRLGNPYVASISDTDGLAGIDYGVYGVPETFIIDKAGVIRHKLIGPITAQSFRDEIVPLVMKLNS